MKYFLDFEFIEGFKKPLFGKRRHFIDLVSVGMVCEDGREFYAISNEFNEKDANAWVRDNVLIKLEPKNILTHQDFHDVQQVPNPIWMSNYEIKNHLIDFMRLYSIRPAHETHDIYTYYGAYDWVLFCSIFGTMAQLPSGLPFLPIDLKQMMIERNLNDAWKNVNCPDPFNEHNALVDAKWNKKLYEEIIKVSR